jgi:hypothetical protein
MTQTLWEMRGELLRDLLFVLCLAGAWAVPAFGAGVFRPIERWGTKLASRKSLIILLAVSAPILIRASFFWLLPHPVPHIHDEFSYLLGGDTLAHGRLANPANPMAVFFDTIHVNQTPAYVSKYPPGQATVLAAGDLLGDPWFGVVLSVGVMCGAIVWMLQGWFAPRWALLGGVLVVAKLGIFSYWMNSYWGGAVAAIGGALVLGALPRIMRTCRARDSLILGLGLFILVNSRPFEGFLFSLPVAVVLLIWVSSKRSPEWGVKLRRVVLPLAIIGIATGAFGAYYNLRTTGNVFESPYVANERAYMRGAPLLSWKEPKPAVHFANPQMESYYNGYIRSVHLENETRTVKGAALKVAMNAKDFLLFFVGPALCLPFALGVLMFRRKTRGVRLWTWQVGLGFGALLLVTWFEPHYLAPMTASIFALVLQGTRRLRQWRMNGRPVGLAISRVVVLFALVLGPFDQRGTAFMFQKPDLIGYRVQFEKQLEATPGKHLVIVRYGTDHNVLREWVYNGADLDNGKVVWAREIPGQDIRPLLEHYKDRQLWLAEPDASPPRLTQCRSSPP